MNNKLSILSFRVQVPNGTTPASPVSLKLFPQNPIVKGIKIIYSPSTVLMQDVGFRFEVGGIKIFPAMGSNDDSNFTSSPGYSAIPNSSPLELMDLDYQIPGAPYEVGFKFINANAAAAYIFGWLFTSPKINLPDLPITSDKLTKKESE